MPRNKPIAYCCHGHGFTFASSTRLVKWWRDSAAKRLRFSFAAGILRRTLRWRNSRGTGRESRDRSFQLFTLSGFLLGISVTCYFLLLHSRLCQSATVKMVRMMICAFQPVWHSVFGWCTQTPMSVTIHEKHMFGALNHMSFARLPRLYAHLQLICYLLQLP